MRSTLLPRLLRPTAVATALAILTVSLGCGTILYPERRGQRTSARIDAGVAVMDALWCLLFIIPGVVAFAVDFSDGAIYLPGGRAGDGTLKVVKTDGRMDPAALEHALREQGVVVRLDDPNLVWRPLHPGDDVGRRLAEARQDRGIR
jgi:hypothetical protein